MQGLKAKNTKLQVFIVKFNKAKPFLLYKEMKFFITAKVFLNFDDIKIVILAKRVDLP